MSISQSGRTKIIKYGILAGVAGGSTEVIWIAAFGILANISAVNVAYGVVAIVGLEISSATLGVLAGVAIHMAAAITAWHRRCGRLPCANGPLAPAEVLRRATANETR